MDVKVLDGKAIAGIEAGKLEIRPGDDRRLDGENGLVPLRTLSAPFLSPF
jgi:hypothetical protein